MPTNRRTPPKSLRVVSAADAPVGGGGIVEGGELDPEVVAKVLRAGRRPLIEAGGGEEACRSLRLWDDA